MSSARCLRASANANLGAFATRLGKGPDRDRPCLLWPRLFVRGRKVRDMDSIVMERRREARLRRLARCGGYSLHKSRAGWSLDNLGDFMVVDDNLNSIVAGERFDMTLDDVEEWLKPLATGQ